MLREIELVHRARKGQEAIRVEYLRETLRLMLEIGLDLEGTWFAVRRAGLCDPPPPEACVELPRATVGDGAELARQSQPGARHSGSLRTISRCSARSAIACAEALIAPEIEINASTSCAYWTQYASTVMPPSDGPMTQATRAMPSARSASRAALAISSTESSGNAVPYGRPDAGSIESGLDDPKGLPSELMQTTCQR